MPVNPEDVTRLLGGLKPGVTYSAKALYRQYVQNMARDERKPEHPVSLGVALRDYGCVKTRIRHRVSGVQHEEAGWTLPMSAPGPVEIDPVAEMIRSFEVTGFYPEEDIWGRYVKLCARNYHTPLPRPRLMAALTLAGHPRQTYNRRVCRWLNVPGS